ncbi:hypothetical protein ACPOL_3986 [Acidisarcina polymorpha]|uniref:Uncharacterized protein n=1 Tax=Acidisarcina polymorpha TaxID=2211140 RepID=A0A2Z5G3R2_9BACT|nr:hypothetical protein [Acidisarcina polymorpha]AXC13265.1 hypothetical protein ACPOL_3986 [Acidisarcina polymorpha]
MQKYRTSNKRDANPLDLLSVFQAARRYSQALEERDRKDGRYGSLVCLFFVLLVLVMIAVFALANAKIKANL